MKQWFAAGLLVLAVGYTLYGLSSLTLLTASGRPAAGFFPLMVGLLLIVLCSINLWGDVREWWSERPSSSAPATGGTVSALGVDLPAGEAGTGYSRDALIVFLYISGFVAIMNIAGALLAMIVFMLAFLFTFNRTQVIGNMIYSLVLPGFLYGLFRLLLNASLPTGPLGF